MKPDIIEVIEAAYRVDQSEAAWVEGILKAALPHLNAGLGTYSYVYDASDISNLRVRSFAAAGQPHDFREDELVAVLAAIPADYVARSFRERTCSLASEVPGFDALASVPAYFLPRGIHDILAVNGRDPTGFGLYLGAALPRGAKLTPRRRATWCRIGTHLAAGFRLHRMLAQRAPAADAATDAEAVLAPSGRVEHAVGPAAENGARAALREAVKRMDHARGSLRRAAPEEAVEEWRGLVAARWSLLDHFESDGRRYLVARRNDPRTEQSSPLTLRERQAIAWAAIGHSNELIAYDLGVAASTVRVLLARAARKLGARSRAEAIAAWGKLLEGI